MKTSFFILAGIFVSFLSFSQTTVKKVTSTVAIDGQLNESFWDISIPVNVNLSSSDNTAHFGVLWDDNYLYVGVNVVDASLNYNGRQGYFDDGIEIYIDGNNSKGTSVEQDDRRFVKPVLSHWIQEANDNIDGVLYKWVKTTDGYTMEFAIPWSNFNVTPSANMNIGFNLAVNDDDIISKYNDPKKLIWQGSKDYYKNPSTWGTVRLSDQTVSYTSGFIALLTPDGENFCINNKTSVIKWVSNGVSNINIDYSTDNGTTWNTVITNLAADAASYNWSVPATPSDQCLIRVSEAGNALVYDISNSVFTISAPLKTVDPLIPNTWKNYVWPYNAYYPKAENGINGHVGNACGPSSLARILHYWEFPVTGNNSLTFTDKAGYKWSANFGETVYNYDNMPGTLPANSTEEEYKDIATLMYHAATSMHDGYGSGGNLSNMSAAMSHYFRYKESTPALRRDYTKAEWIKLLINELDNGRVLLITAMTTEVLGDWDENTWIAGHWFHVDGYNEDGLFHGVLGFSNEDGWFDIDKLFNYYLNNGILVGLEPDLNGKELALRSLNGGEILRVKQSVQINWTSTNVSNIRIEYTLDNGQNWSEIINSTPASAGTYTWQLPATTSIECKIKLTDTDDVNVYDKSDNTFSLIMPGIELTYPLGGEQFLTNSILNITWKATSVQDVKLEYSMDNGNSWTEIVNSTPASAGYYEWTTPGTVSAECKIRITDVSDNSVSDVSENSFNILHANNAGGPYSIDDNTVLLFHFERNLVNQSSLSDDGTLQGDNISYAENPVTDMGMCAVFDGSSYISVPHNENLSLSGDWTIEAWVNFTNFGTGSYVNPSIVSKSDSESFNYALWYHSKYNSIKGHYSDNNLNVPYVFLSNILSTGTWYHITYIRDNTNYLHKIIIRDENRTIIAEKEYIYGESKSQAKTNTNELKIANALGVDGFYFIGYIDEVRISRVIRSFNNTTAIKTTSTDRISIYPNPASRSVHITVPEKGHLSIFDISGRKVYENPNFTSGTLDVSGFDKGIYFVRFFNKSGDTFKLVIE